MNEELRERLIRAWIGQDTDPDVAAAYWDDSAASVDVILAEIEAAGYRIVKADRLDRLRHWALVGDFRQEYADTKEHEVLQPGDLD